jgi:aldose 1-epimerase
MIRCCASGCSSSLQRLVVFTQPVRDFVAIEPVSHVNNALNLVERDPLLRLHELGVEVLEPGQTLSASMRLVVGRRS